MAPKTEADGARPDADWYWRGIRLRNYRSPMVQVALVGFIAFMTVGMSSALGGAGGGGLLNTKQSTNANVAVYVTFAALAFFSGTIYNRVGIRVCLAFGGFGYALLSAAYMATAHLEDKATPFIVVAGCVEGLSAAMLWTAQGAVTMSYPTEDQKGRAFSTFWTIFQMGGVIGSIIPIAANWNSSAGTLNDGTYIAFIVIMLTGSFVLPFFLLPSDKVVRSDGTRVVLPEMPTWKSEIVGLVSVLFEDKWIITLFPFFIASNWFYTYQKNDFNVPNFTLRTRSFNGLFSNLFNMVGVWAMGLALDYRPDKFSRKLRARIGIIALLTVTLAIWGGGWAMVKDFKRGDHPVPLIDVTESKRYAPYVIMYIFWAMYDGIFQAYAYWLMGSLSNNSRRLSHYAGWYKSLQSAGAAIVWRLDGLEVSYKSMYLSTWMIMVFAVITAFYVAFSRVQEHCNDEPQTAAAPSEGSDIEAASTTSKGDGKEMEVEVTTLPAKS
ncbi:major facilitator superfamily domain-containing protein [Schizophyllum commune]